MSDHEKASVENPYAPTQASAQQPTSTALRRALAKFFAAVGVFLLVLSIISVVMAAVPPHRWISVVITLVMAVGSVLCFGMEHFLRKG